MLDCKRKEHSSLEKVKCEKRQQEQFPTEVQPKMACVLGLEPEYGIDGNKSSH